MTANQPYLADTNILVHLIRDDASGRQIKTQYGLLMLEITPAYCTVTQGEIRSLAYQWNWGFNRMDQMNFLLDYFRAVSIETPDVVEAYAVIDSYSKSVGVTMGKNDLWIAAAARVGGFILLTSDRDFDHLHNKFLICERISKD